MERILGPISKVFFVSTYSIQVPYLQYDSHLGIIYEIRVFIITYFANISSLFYFGLRYAKL